MALRSAGRAAPVSSSGQSSGSSFANGAWPLNVRNWRIETSGSIQGEGKGTNLDPARASLQVFRSGQPGVAQPRAILKALGLYRAVECVLAAYVLDAEH